MKSGVLMAVAAASMASNNVYTIEDRFSRMHGVDAFTDIPNFRPSGCAVPSRGRVGSSKALKNKRKASRKARRKNR